MIEPIINAATYVVGSKIGKKIGNDLVEGCFDNTTSGENATDTQAEHPATSSDSKQATSPAKSSNNIWWSIGGLVLLGLAWKVGIPYLQAYAKESGKNRAKRRFMKQNTESVKEVALPTNKPAEPVNGQTISEAIQNAQNNSISETEVIGNLLYRNQIGFCMGEPDVGKTLFLLGLCPDIAEGRPLKIFPDSKPSTPCDVEYYALETDGDDLKRRFKDEGESCPSNLKIYQLDDFDTTDIYESIMCDIEARIEKAQTDTLIILDNLSKIQDMTNRTIIRNTYERIEAVQKRTTNKGINITVLIVAHTNRKLSNRKPITKDLFSGSWEAVKQAKSIFAIGEGQLGEGYRYLKNLKLKTGPKTKDVPVIKIVEHPYLHCEYVKTIPEEEAIRPNKSDATYDNNPVLRGRKVEYTEAQCNHVVELLKEGYGPKEIQRRCPGLSISKIKRIKAKWKSGKLV